MDVRTGEGMDVVLHLPWWKRRGSRQLALGVSALALCVATAVATLGPADRTLRLDADGLVIATVEQGLFRDFIHVRGNVVPRDTVVLDALEGGRVDRILAQSGDTVDEGQPLIELSNTQLELDVLDRESRLIQSITQLQTYEMQLEQNRVANHNALVQIEYDITRLTRQVERRDRLVSQSLDSVENRDLLRDDLERALRLKPLREDTNRRQDEVRARQLPQIHAQVEKLQHDLRITHAKLQNLTVRAPVDGLLTVLDLRVGENRDRGERLAEIVAATGHKVTATVDEFYLGRVRPGQKADVELDLATHALVVTRVHPQVREGGFQVDLAFEGTPPAGLLPGQSLQGRLDLGRDTPARVLRTGAFLERSGGDYVFVVDEGGDTARRRPIRLGRRNAEQVEVLDGLAPGERVIVSGYDGLERMDRIQLDR